MFFLKVPFVFTLLLVLLGSSVALVGANTWYVSPAGTNSTANGNGLSPEEPIRAIAWAFNNAAEPGDTILVMEGVYRNGGFGSGNLNNGPAVYLNNSGTEGSPIVLKNYPGHRPVIEFDGAGGMIANQLEHVEISGFHIIGPGSRITEEEAMDHRLDLPKPNYYNGRGIAIWGPANHITISHNTVQDCPGSGIRINKGDYLTISHNEVFRNTRYTSAAESAIVIAEAESIDEEDTIKIRIENNLAYDNQNLIPFFTPNPPDVGIEDYGTEDQDYIIDGSGVYMTRNKSYEYGWFYLANNISFNNGINGLVVHRTDRAYVVNNTSYLNGATPLSSGRQSSSGITLNNAEHVRVYNNISWSRFEDDMVLGSFGELKDIVIEGNLIFKGTTDFEEEGYIRADPEFYLPSIDPDLADFWLRETSPGVGAGIWNEFVPETDFYGFPRDETSVDIGAVAFRLREESMISEMPSASQIIEGQSLAESGVFFGEASFNGEALPGRFYFEDRGFVPTEAGEEEQTFVFIPDDREEYTPAWGEVSVEVVPADYQTPEKNTPVSFYQEVGLFPAHSELLTFAELDLLDSDGDGMLNWQEYLAGTDPTDRESVLRIHEITRESDGSVSLAWTGGTLGPNTPYVIETSTNLSNAPGDWVEIDTVDRQEGEHTWSGHGLSGEARFFRVRAHSEE
ncbi:MAG: right-handed parallel beta-helix repeat-containing protein [Opitutales bacterium]|nr:right-handed parallel beta-helix repeat-containing protein [Opitutales bacterium]MCH8539373.1 right-handed parallel beta-helix repeat-containing protein [Opitutales bacterium]